MKYFFLFIFVFETINLSAQTLTKQEAIEDIDYFYQMLKRHHPNPYCFTPQSVVDSCIEDFKSKCYDSMPRVDFRYHFSHLNYLFDSHTGYSIRQYRSTKSDRLFPRVYFKDHKIHLLENDWEILSINSIPVDSIVERVRMNFGAENSRREFEACICLRCEFQGGIVDFGIHEPPFTVKCKTLKHRDTTIILEGETKKSLRKLLESYEKDCTPYRFELYPEEKIAIIRYGEVFNRRNFKEFDTLLNNFFQDCHKQNIRHLFFDVSRNPGGDFYECSYFFPYLQMNKKKSFRLRVEKPDYVCENEISVGGIQQIREIQPFKGNIYIYQSFHTQSAAPFFCAFMKVLANAVLVGTETGSGLPLYGGISTFYLPNTHDQFTISTSYFKEVSPKLPRTLEGYLLPDIEYPMLTDRLLNVEDCLRIIALKKQIK